METLLPEPELQFVDANGVPYAGGTLALYEPGTTTPKNSWIDMNGTTLNTNPIVLDAAGRCIVWGDGLYRCVLQDANGNLIYDQLSTTLVSAAMIPVVIASTLADARAAMGVTDAIQAETNRALAAEDAITSGGTGYATVDALTAETNRAEAAENTLQTNITNETNRAMAAESALGAGSGQIIYAGHGVTDGGGQCVITFPSAFPNAIDAMVATEQGPNWIQYLTVGYVTVSSATVFVRQDAGGGPPVSGASFFWVAVGH
jgi:hypothetical protein